MKYQFENDKLQLIKYTVEVKQIIPGYDINHSFDASTEAERDAILEKYPEATVTGDAVKGFVIEAVEHIEEDSYVNRYNATTDEQKDKLVEQYPDATVTPIDNTGYEWLDGKTFTQEQINAGILQVAIEQGEAGYNKYISQNDPNYHIATLEAAVLELAQMMAEAKSEANA